MQKEQYKEDKETRNEEQRQFVFAVFIAPSILIYENKLLRPVRVVSLLLDAVDKAQCYTRQNHSK